MASKVVLVYGGAGALGRSLVSTFKSHAWRVVSVDVFKNDDADANVTLQLEDAWTAQADAVAKGVAAALNGDKLNAVLCVAGGWAGGNAADASFVANTELMVKQSIHSSVIAAHVAAHHLAENGLITLTGARAALSGTAGMIGYGLAKAAVHQLTHSLGQPGSGLPAGTTAVAILPVTLDTPANRKFAAPDTDFGTWTSLEALSTQLFEWANGTGRPTSGSLVKVETTGGKTTFTAAL